MADLLDIAANARALLDALQDPAAGPESIASGLAVVRTFPAIDTSAGPPAPNLDLLAPTAGVPRPSASEQVEPGGTVAPADLGVSPPFKAAGPSGPPGDIGPAGPPGPPGPGTDPARLAALEAALADLQELAFTELAFQYRGR